MCVFLGKLAALWPFLGICAEVFVLCAIILIYEKRRNKAELDESDTDQSPEQWVYKMDCFAQNIRFVWFWVLFFLLENFISYKHFFILPFSGSVQETIELN